MRMKQPLFFRFAAFVFSLVGLWLTSPSAVPAETAAPTTGTLKIDRLPSGETAAEFLIHQVGGGYAELTTDTQKKKPLQLLMEDIVLADGRKNAKGKWIDNIPDTKPSPLPDIAPPLTTMTLYYDREAVYNHWDAFKKRYFLIANHLNDKAGRPLPLRMPGENWAQWLESMNSSNHPIFKNREEYWKDMGGLFLYVDFLYARGDAEAKQRAFDLVRAILIRLTCSPVSVRDSVFSKYVLKGIVWPMTPVDVLIPPKEGCFCDDPVGDLCYVLNDSEQDELRFQKWIVKHAPDDYGRKSGFLAERSNRYVLAGDYTGALFCTLAFRDPKTFYRDTIKTTQILFEKQFGTQRGNIYYRRFVECIAPIATDSYVGDELKRLKNDDATSATAKKSRVEAMSN
jgi:hypothetical protein